MERSERFSPTSVPTEHSDQPHSEPFFVAVHIGVGFHSEKNRVHKRHAIGRACRAARDCLQSHGEIRDAVVAAIRILEDSPFTNAGHGSNLTFDGSVECDAGIMSGDGEFGAVGAAPGLCNPIEVASCLAKRSAEPLSCGRVQPTFLAGDGARLWALERGLPASKTMEDAKKLHVTDASKAKWKRYIEMVQSNDDKQDGGEASSDQEAKLTSGEEGNDRKRRRVGDVCDTVGCVVVDSQGAVCAGVSSGGLAVKVSGRVGEAALYGAGCWAKHCNTLRFPSVATSVSGVGELVSRALVARLSAHSMLAQTADPLDFILEETITQATDGWANPANDIGLIALRASRAEVSQEMVVEFAVGHNSESMGFGCLGSDGKLMVDFLPKTLGTSHDSVPAVFGAAVRWKLGGGGKGD
ncbi:hypothetical protein BSKO_00753 [Bryopsis sp. KO-2023]|nr:hypothetical protein BSKO_00753 [Bryopsis sp. KO-2023]